METSNSILLAYVLPIASFMLAFFTGCASIACFLEAVLPEDLRETKTRQYRMVCLVICIIAAIATGLLVKLGRAYAVGIVVS